MDKEYMEALVDISEIFNHLDIDLLNKIPKKFKDFVESYKSKEYKSNIDFSTNINKQELKKETRAILSLIYRSYILDENKRLELEKYDLELQKIEEDEKREKYDIYNIWERKKKINLENNQMIEVKKMNFFQKILKNIKYFILSIMKR